MRFPRQESGSHRRLQIRGATGSVCLGKRSVFSPEPHLFWVQDDWQLGAGPNRSVSARRCARVTCVCVWGGGKQGAAEPLVSTVGSSGAVRTDASLRKHSSKTNPTDFPGAPRRRVGGAGLVESTRRPAAHVASGSAQRPRATPRVGVWAPRSTRLHSVVNKSMVAASSLVCLRTIRTLRGKRLRNT